MMPLETKTYQKTVVEKCKGPDQALNIKLEEAPDKLYNLSLFSTTCGSEIQCFCLKMDNVLYKEKLDELR